MKGRVWVIAAVLALLAVVVVGCVNFAYGGEASLAAAPAPGPYPPGTPTPVVWRPGIVVEQDFYATPYAPAGIVGSEVELYWSQTQPNANGALSLSYALTRIAQVAAQGNGAWLSVEIFSDRGVKPNGTPDLIRLPTGVPTVQYYSSDAGCTDYAPDYSNETFRAAYDQFVKALVAATKNSVAGYILRMGVNGETIPVVTNVGCPNTLTEFEKVVACDAYRAWVERGIKTWKEAAPDKVLYVQTYEQACKSLGDFTSAQWMYHYINPPTPYPGALPKAVNPTKTPMFVGGRSHAANWDVWINWGYGQRDAWGILQLGDRWTDEGGYAQSMGDGISIAATPDRSSIVSHMLYNAVAHQATNIILWPDWIPYIPDEVMRTITMTIGTGPTDSPAVWVLFREAGYRKTGDIPTFNYGVSGAPGSQAHLATVEAISLGTPTPVCAPSARQTTVAGGGTYDYPPAACWTTATPMPTRHKSWSYLHYAPNAVIGIDVADDWQWSNSVVTYTAKLDYAATYTGTIDLVWWNGSQRVTDTINVTPAGDWATYTATLANAVFNNSLSGGTDIEIHFDANSGALHRLLVEYVAGTAATVTPTLTPTPRFTRTNTPTPTGSPTDTSTPTFTFTPTQTRTPTSTMTNTPTPTSTPTAGASPTLTWTVTGTLTDTPTRTDTPTLTYTPTRTNTPLATNTITATATSTATSTPTASVTPAAQMPQWSDIQTFGIYRGAPDVSFPEQSYNHFMWETGVGYSASAILWAPNLTIFTDTYTNTHVLTATLTLRVDGVIGLDGGGKEWAGLYRLTKEWEATALTWIDATAIQGWDKPGAVGPADRDFTTQHEFVLPGNGETQTITIDVTQDLKAWLYEGKPNYGWVLHMTPPDWSTVLVGYLIGGQLYGDRYPVIAYRPQLDVTMGVSAEPTATPTATFTWTPMPTPTYTPVGTLTPTNTPTVVPTPTYTPYGGAAVPTTDLELWYRADVGVTESGGVVSAWADQSGNARDAGQANASYRPLLVAAAQNGQPAIRFDGSDNFMTFTLDLNGFTEVSVFLVTANLADQEGGWSHAGNSALYWKESAFYGTFFVSPFQDQVLWHFGTTEEILGPTYDRPVSLGTGYSESNVIKNGGSEVLYINGSAVYTETGLFTTLAGIGTTGALARGYNDDSFFSGDIAEVLIYSRALTSTDRGLVDTYLQGKYFSTPPTATPTPTATATATSGVPTATPTPTATPAALLRLNEVCPDVSVDLNLDWDANLYDRYIEIVNWTGGPLNLEGHQLQWFTEDDATWAFCQRSVGLGGDAQNLGHTYVFPRYSRIAAHGYKVLFGEDTFAPIGDGGEWFEFPGGTTGYYGVALCSPGGTLLDVVYYNWQGANRCWQRDYANDGWTIGTYTLGK